MPRVIAASLIFAATYFFLAGGRLPGLRLDRNGAAVAGAVAMVVFGVLTPQQAVQGAVNWDTILLLLGMMVLTSALSAAGVFRFTSSLALRTARGPRGLLVALVLVSGALSALLVNDTVCLLCTPLVLAIVDDAELPALPYLLALAFGSNAGSVATPTGNPQNMLIGTLSGIGYGRFAAALLLPAAVSLAVVAVVLLVAFRRELSREGPLAAQVPRPPLRRGLALLCALVFLGVLAGFLLGHSLAWTAMAGAAVLLVFSREPPRELFARVDGTLLLFFAALFIVTHGIAQAGIAGALFDALSPLLGTTAAGQTLSFAAFTVAACQLVSNVPFVLLAARWIPGFLDPHLAWLSLAAVSTLAGNLTPVASVANLIVLEQAGERGRVSFGRFLRLGALCTFIPVLLALAILLVERRLGLLFR